MTQHKLNPAWCAAWHPGITNQNHEIKSDPDPLYNCVAWAAGETQSRWWPEDDYAFFWPDGVPREETIAAFMQAFATKGYERCNDGDLEAGWEKIAIYANNVGTPQHVALQLEAGQWTSKLGILHDIEHSTPNVLTDNIYGQPVEFMRRPREQED